MRKERIGIVCIRQIYEHENHPTFLLDSWDNDPNAIGMQ